MLNPECLLSNMMFQGELPLAKFQVRKTCLCFFAFGFAFGFGFAFALGFY